MRPGLAIYQEAARLPCLAVSARLGTFAFARITGRGCRPVKSRHALPPNSGMAGLRRLFDHPAVLADGSSQGASMARPREVAFSCARSRMDRHVDRSRSAHRPMAQRDALFNTDVVGSSRCVVCRRHPSLLTFRSPFQLGAVGRSAGSSCGNQCSATHHNRNPRPSPPSRLSRSSL